MLHKLVIPGGQTSGMSTLLKWNKNPGDEVVKWDVIAEVETDKTVLEIECPVRKGIFLGGYFEEGDVIPAGTIIGSIGDIDDKLPPQEGETTQDVAAEIKPDLPAKEEQESQTSNTPSQVAVKATPGARRLAKENKVNLEDIPLSSGVINEDIVRAFISSSHTSTAAGLTEMPVDQHVVAEALVNSLNQTAQYNQAFKVDATNCLNALHWLNAGKEKADRITLNDLVIKAASIAIGEYPLVNHLYSEEGLKKRETINFGLAVSVDNSLIVPVVKNVGQKSVQQIAKENKENIASVRTGKYDRTILADGTITLSGVGNLGVYHSVAILNTGESCILVVNSIMDDLKMENGEVIAYKSFLLSGTFDHRLINGAYAAQFMGRVKNLLEETESLLV